VGKAKVQEEGYTNSGRGANPNPRYGNVGGGSRGGLKREKPMVTKERERHFKSKMRREQDYGRMGVGGPTHCFNCNRDGHFQASYTNPPFCYNCKKDGHRAMTCLAKKELT
jgi:hypothetical protein